MGVFFIDTVTGQLALERQLQTAGLAAPGSPPGPRWHRVQGSADASTLWYAVMRRQLRGVFIGTLCIRHSERWDLLTRSGWEEVPPHAIGAGLLGVQPDVAPSPLD